VNGKEPKEDSQGKIDVDSEDVFEAARYVARTLSYHYGNLQYEVDRVHEGSSQQVMTTHIISD